MVRENRAPHRLDERRFYVRGYARGAHWLAPTTEQYAPVLAKVRHMLATPKPPEI